MTTRLIIARHGNTFTSDQTPTRVGCRTDLPLVPSGQEQARRIGGYLKDNNYSPAKIYTSVLKRTIEMAEIIEDVMGHSIPQKQHPMFNEIDYGPDENIPESAVIQRIGAESIQRWNEEAIVPDGWIVDTRQIVTDWKNFGDSCVREHKGQTTLAITSNGIARFSPYLTGDFGSFGEDLKISTGALCVFIYDFAQERWDIKDWNIKP